MSDPRVAASAAALASIFLLAATAPAALAAGTTERVSVGPSGHQADGSSTIPTISGDGRRVAFTSDATDLVAGVGPDELHVYVRDRAAGTTVAVDRGPGGALGAGGCCGSQSALISRDGRFVAFDSSATNLVLGDTNGAFDVFVRDLGAGTTARVSLKPSGAEVRGGDLFGNAISADGRYVLFHTAARGITHDPRGRAQLLLRDRLKGRTTIESRAQDGTLADDQSGTQAAISGDGRFVAFVSEATNLAAGATGGQGNIFVRDRKTGKVVLASGAVGGAAPDGSSHNPAISDDGNLVAFDSQATNLVPGDTNDRLDVFVRDIEAGTTTRVSLGAGGAEADSNAAAGDISPDGRYVLYASAAGNVVAGAPDGGVFLYDRQARTTTRVDVSGAGAGANRDGGGFAHLSANGRVVAFDSDATNLVPNDTNKRVDVFVRTLGGGKP